MQVLGSLKTLTGKVLPEQLGRRGGVLHRYGEPSWLCRLK